MFVHISLYMNYIKDHMIDVHSQQIRSLHWWCVVVQIQSMRSHWWTYWNSCYQLGLTLPYMTGEQTLITVCERSLEMVFNQSQIFPANHGLVYWQYKYTKNATLKVLRWKAISHSKHESFPPLIFPCIWYTYFIFCFKIIYLIN